jgi:hypothetical protein
MADRMNGTAAATTATDGGSARGADAGLVPRQTTGATVVETVRGLELRGLDGPAARNIAALAFGIRPARNGWSVAEIEHLRFLRAIVREGSLEP